MDSVVSDETNCGSAIPESRTHQGELPEWGLWYGGGELFTEGGEQDIAVFTH